MMVATGSKQEPWISLGFLKDAKLRSTERYWREDLPWTEQEPVARMIPDAVTWRKYLRLIRTIVEDYSVPLLWIITESAVELMDHRNSSLNEASAPQERNAIQRLVQKNEATVAAFPDLSVRLEQDDEWDFMNYEQMDIAERGRQAQVRAAGLIKNSATMGDSVRSWLVVDSLDNLLPLEEDDFVKYVTIQDLINDELAKHLSTEQVDRLSQLKRACEEEYTLRNTASSVKEAEELVSLSQDEIQKRLKSGKLLRGRLNVTKENFKEAFVNAANQTYFVCHEHFKRSFHQDIVLIEPLPESQWGRPVGRRRLVHYRLDDDDADQAGDLDLPAVPSARVVTVDRPSRRIFVATMIDMPNSDEGAVLVVPMDTRVPKIRIRTRSWRRFEGQRLKVEVTGWETGPYPIGHCVEVLGPIGELETEIKALLIEHEVELEPFSTEAIACLPVEGTKWRVPQDEVQRRRDLRSTRRVFSVDPPGCQDIDDTMHAEILPNGDIEVGVHIADVTHFVKHNSKLDIEAQVRGTTFYLVDRRFDMLPSLLSANLCSLHGGTDRLALSVIWVLSPDFMEIKDSWFGRTTIHNCAAMTYDQADNILRDKTPEESGKPLPPPLTAGAPVDPQLIGLLKQDLSILTRLARKLRKDREELGGAVDLTSSESGSELKFTLDSEGNPSKVVPKEDKEIHHTIAEMMIMANTHVATRIQTYFPETALLRVHRPVDESRFEELQEILAAAGVELDGSDGTSLANSLKEAQARLRSEKSSLQSLVLNVATRAMTEAQYISTGDRKDGEDLSHYGLGLQKYTHFTSPIRRYADVIVHKQLLSSIRIDSEERECDVRVSRVELAPLKDLPDSNVVSIFAGQGLSRDDEAPQEEDNDLDMLIEGASELALGTAEEARARVVAESTIAPYTKSEVSSICEGLNLHNRLAKHSSYECQGLFLSLYFKNHVERTRGVVTSVRENGFVVYVPKYDVRGPVYVRDVNSDVQVDPSLLGLPPDSGLTPTMAFASSGRCRRFVHAVCELVDGPDLRLEVRVPGSSDIFVVRPFDTVEIELTCDNWDVRARVPAPRLQLLPTRSPVATTPKTPTSRFNITSENLARQQTKGAAFPIPEVASSKTASLFSIASNRTIHPVLLGVPLRSNRSRSAVTDRKETLKGRLVFSDFCNPDTLSAAQEAAQQAAASETLERRAAIFEASTRRNDFDSARSVERSITMRQQRLASDKRSTRRSKAK